jgi:hypothetical protein
MVHETENTSTKYWLDANDSFIVGKYSKTEPRLNLSEAVRDDPEYVQWIVTNPDVKIAEVDRLKMKEALEAAK